MLEGITIVGDVIVVVVGIGEEVVTRGKDVAGGEVGCRQMGLGGVFDDEEVLGVVCQVLTELIAQVGVRVTVADNLHGVGSTDAAVVGGDDDVVVGLCQLSEEVGDDGVLEPREGDAAIRRLVVGQLAHHLRLGTGMAEHVDEVEHHDVEVVLLQRLQLSQQLVGFLLGEGVVAAIALQLGADERFLVEVLAFLLVFIDPQVGKHLGDLHRHQTGEDGVAGILCRCGQDAAIDVLADVELVANLALQHLPLVVAEVVEPSWDVPVPASSPCSSS